MKFFDSRKMAFTIESMTLRIMVFSGKNIESWYSVPLGPKSVREGMVAMPEVVGGALAEVIQENKLPKIGVVCAVPSGGSATQTLSLPGVKKGNLKEIVMREIKRTMPGSQDVDYVYWQLMPGDDGKQKQEVYALAVPRHNISGIVDVCRASGIGLKGIELKPFALLRAVSCKSGVIVHGEVDNIEIVVVENSFPGMFRSVPVKEASPTQEAACQNLLRELPFTIDYYNWSYRDAQLSKEAPVYLSGELALDPKLAMDIQDVTGREVVGAELSIESPPNFPVAQFLPHVGLMLREKW